MNSSVDIRVEMLAAGCNRGCNLLGLFTVPGCYTRLLIFMSSARDRDEGGASGWANVFFGLVIYKFKA